MKQFFLRRIAVASLVACFCFLYMRFPVQAQAPSENSQWFSAQNRWQLTAVDPASQTDTATSELRAKRNAYLQHQLEVAREWREPTGLPAGVISSTSGGSFSGDFAEISAPAHAVWVIAKFESFHVFTADAQYRLIYTEINYRVSQVLRQPPSLSLAVGSTFDQEWPGGRMKKPDGSIASFSVQPEAHSMQPGGTYLMVGTYDAPTGYFDMSNWWDLSSGKVVPGTLVEIIRAANGNSKLNGLTAAQAIAYLDSILPRSD